VSSAWLLQFRRMEGKQTSNLLNKGGLNDASLRIGLGQVDIVGEGVNSNVVFRHRKEGKGGISGIGQTPQPLRLRGTLQNIAK